MRRREIAIGLTGVLTLLLTGASIYAWTRNDAGARSDPRSTTEVERGRALFHSKGCAACHNVARKDIVGGGFAGPDLSGLADSAGLRVEGQSAEAYVRASILNPDAYIAPGNNSGFGMPRIDITADELNALVAFLLDDR